MESGFTAQPQRRLPQPPREEFKEISSALAPKTPLGLYGPHFAGKRAILREALRQHPQYERANYLELPLHYYVWRFEPEEALLALRRTVLAQLGYPAESVGSKQLSAAIRNALSDIPVPVISILSAELFLSKTGKVMAEEFRKTAPVGHVTWVLHVNAPAAAMRQLKFRAPFQRADYQEVDIRELELESACELAQALAPWWSKDDVQVVMNEATGGSRGLFFELARRSRGTPLRRLIESAAQHTGPFERYFADLLKAFADRPGGFSVLSALRERDQLDVTQEDLLMLTSWNLVRPRAEQLSSCTASLATGIPAVRRWLRALDL